MENPDANDDVDMPLSKPDTPDGSSDAAGAWTTEVRQPMKLGHLCAAPRGRNPNSHSKESVGMSDINPAYKSAFLMRVTRVPIRAMASAAQ